MSQTDIFTDFLLREEQQTSDAGGGRGAHRSASFCVSLSLNWWMCAAHGRVAHSKPISGIVGIVFEHVQTH